MKPSCDYKRDLKRLVDSVLYLYDTPDEILDEPIQYKTLTTDKRTAAQVRLTNLAERLRVKLQNAK